MGDELNLPFGLILAFASAALLNTSLFFQHRASNRVDDLHLRHPVASLRALASNPIWLLACCGGAFGWGCYIGALHYAPLSLVQAFGAGGLSLLALLAHRLGTPLPRRDRIAGVIATVGVVLLCSSLTVTPTDVRPRLEVILAVVLIGMIIAGMIAWLGCAFRGSGIALGVATGVFYSMSDVATKGALEGLGLILIPLVLMGSALGFAVLHLAFQRDEVLATAGLSSLVNTVVPIVVGIILFGEVLPGGPAGWARAVGFVLSMGGGVLLSRREYASVAPRKSRVVTSVRVEESGAPLG